MVVSMSSSNQFQNNLHRNVNAYVGYGMFKFDFYRYNGF